MAILASQQQVGPHIYTQLCMVRVAPGSRSPFWSQNQVKVLIDRESSYYIKAPPKIRARYFFSNSTRFAALVRPVVMYSVPNVIYCNLFGPFRTGFCLRSRQSLRSRRDLCPSRMVLADAAPWRAYQRVAAQRTACVWQVSSRCSSRAALAHLSAPPATLAALGLGQLRTVACKRGRLTQFKF